MVVPIVFYDAHCQMCSATVLRLHRHGLQCAPLQGPLAQRILGDEARLDAVRMRDRRGQILVGATAALGALGSISRLPLHWLTRLPLIGQVLHWGYHRIAVNRNCSSETQRCALPGR